MLYAPQAFEPAIDHYSQPGAQCLTLLHAGTAENIRTRMSAI